MNNQIISIKVLGSGCPSCHKLFERTKEASAQLKTGIEVEYIQDMQEVLASGALSLPVLMINGKIASAGQVLDVEKIKDLINLSNQSITDDEIGACCCGHHC